MKIILNELEQALANLIAERRHEHCLQIGARERKFGEQDGFEIELNGAGGEVAFCKLFNLYPDLSVMCIPDVDVWLVTGESVDVKSTKYDDPYLKTPLWKKEKATDLYALMFGGLPAYELIGIVSRRDFFQGRHVRDLKRGLCYVMYQDEVRAASIPYNTTIRDAYRSYYMRETQAQKGKKRETIPFSRQVLPGLVSGERTIPR